MKVFVLRLPGVTLPLWVTVDSSSPVARQVAPSKTDLQSHALHAYSILREELLACGSAMRMHQPRYWYNLPMPILPRKRNIGLIPITDPIIGASLTINFKCTLKIYGIWLQASIDTHTLPQCSPASVGLAQANPNCKNAWYHFWCHHALLLLQMIGNRKWTWCGAILSSSGLVASWVSPRWCWLPWTVTHPLSSFYWTWAATSMHRLLLIASVQEW